MARANRIYIVKERDYKKEANLAAFTVKHELIYWIEQNEKDYLGSDGMWYIEVQSFDNSGKYRGTFEIQDVLDGKRLI